MLEEREPIAVHGRGCTPAVAAPQVRVANRIALRVIRTARIDAALFFSTFSVVLRQAFPIAMLQVAGTEALEKVLVPRGITLQPYFVGAAHEWRAAAKRSSPAQRTERTHAQDGSA